MRGQHRDVHVLRLVQFAQQPIDRLILPLERVIEELLHVLDLVAELNAFHVPENAAPVLIYLRQIQSRECLLSFQFVLVEVEAVV